MFDDSLIATGLLRGENLATDQLPLSGSLAMQAAVPPNAFEAVRVLPSGRCPLCVSRN
jgi:hypothetical protein